MTERKYFYRKLFVMFLLCVALIATFSVIGFAQTAKTIHYVALGDSLAAGQTPYPQEDGRATFEKGYVGYLVDYLQQQNDRVYLNNYGHSGYTTSDILTEIQTIPEQREAIKQANVITLSVGANDLLKGALDPVAEQVDIEKAKTIIATIAQNMEAILAEIQMLNPDADVYVMGYYHAFPYLDSDHQSYMPILFALHMLNGTLETAAGEFEMTFVPTLEAMEKDVNRYLPNPRDIHPSTEGYAVLANIIWGKMRFDAPFNWKEVGRGNREFTQNVPLNKTWTIILNTKVDEMTITDETVYIVDSKFKRVPVSLKLQGDQKTIKVTPQNEYTPNETYRLYITDGVQSAAGKNLKQPVSMVFTTTNK